MKLKYDFALQQVADFWAAVPVGERSYNYNAVISLNESARDMMELLREEINEEELVQQMLCKYEVDEKTLRQHVSDFIAKLREAKVLV